MTGAEHYRQAERLLAAAADCAFADHECPSRAQISAANDRAKAHRAAAQVHATLALAAAVAPPAPWEGGDPE